MKLNTPKKDRASVRAGMSPQEIAAMVTEVSEAELTDELLEGVSGGNGLPFEEDPYADLPTGAHCPKCGYTKYHWHPGGCVLVCDKCSALF